MNAPIILSPIPRLAPADAEDRERYEIIDGQRVEMPPVSANANVTASELSRHLGNFGTANNLGISCTETLFRLPLDVDRNRRPDVAFVPFSRWPRGRPIPDSNAWDVLPDLAVEVVSPNDMAEELLEKVCEYFRAGVRLVWVVYPRHQLVYVYESLTQVSILTRADELDGGPVLPGFRLPLANIFPEPPTPPAAPA